MEAQNDSVVLDDNHYSGDYERKSLPGCYKWFYHYLSTIKNYKVKMWKLILQLKKNNWQKNSKIFSFLLKSSNLVKIKSDNSSVKSTWQMNTKISD